jgi:hypothetical protein
MAGVPPRVSQLASSTAAKPWEEYRIATLSGVRGEVAKLIGDETYASEETGLHGIFLRRVADLRAAD